MSTLKIPLITTTQSSVAKKRALVIRTDLHPPGYLTKDLEEDPDSMRNRSGENQSLLPQEGNLHQEQ